MLHKVYLLLGSNRGNRPEMLSLATELIQKQAGKITASSSVYETAPWGFFDETFFLNQVLCIETLLSPHDLLEALLHIETSIGRKRRGTNYTSRLIDIDILFYGDHIINHEHLTVPHPRLHERRFVLLPLTEIAASLVHPLLKLTIGELVLQCKDSSEVNLFFPKPVPQKVKTE
jgi:2-amino-4-hydroxy-6-hydroxymethyldihydropteridine diphosphokinase